MPNYGLIIDSTYNPISYEQYVAPFIQYAEVYNKIADQYDALEMEANKWEKLAKESGSEKSYKQYETYAKELRQAAQDLAENGITNKTRSSLSNLRSKYASIISPIEEKYEYRQKLIEEQRKANPIGDIQWTTDYANMGLDSLNLNSSYSGRKLSDIEKEGFEQATAYSSRMSQNALALAGQYYRIRQGYGQQYADAFLQNIALGNDSNYPASSVRELTDLFNYIKQSQGIGISGSPYTIEQDAVASDRLASGILKGLTMKDSYQIVRDDITNGTGGLGGSKKTTPSYNVIGYTLIVNGKEYTEVNEGGTTVYYDKDGNKYTQKIIGADDNGDFIYGYANGTNYIDFAKQTEDEKKLSKERFAIIPADDTSYNMYIVDLWNRDSSGQPTKVTQDGKVVRFDNRTQRFNPVTRKIEDIATLNNSSKNDKQTVPLYSGAVIVSNIKGTDYAYGINKEDKEKKKTRNIPGSQVEFTEDDIPVDSPALIYEDLNEDELLQIPDNIKNFKDYYVFYRITRDADGGFTGNNNLIAWVPAKTVKAENQNSPYNEQYDPNGLPNKKEG